MATSLFRIPQAESPGVFYGMAASVAAPFHFTRHKTESGHFYISSKLRGHKEMRLNRRARGLLLLGFFTP